MKCPLCGFEYVLEWYEDMLMGMREYTLFRQLCTRCDWRQDRKVVEDGS